MGGPLLIAMLIYFRRSCTYIHTARSVYMLTIYGGMWLISGLVGYPAYGAAPLAYYSPPGSLS